MIRVALVVGLCLVPGLALAKEAQTRPEIAGLALAMRQLETSVTLYGEMVSRLLADKDREIAELRAKCGDPCAKEAADKGEK